MLLNAKVEFSIFVAGLLLAAVTSDIRSVKMDFNIPHGFFSFCGVRKDTRHIYRERCMYNSNGACTRCGSYVLELLGARRLCLPSPFRSG